MSDGWKMEFTDEGPPTADRPGEVEVKIDYRQSMSIALQKLAQVQAEHVVAEGAITYLKGVIAKKDKYIARLEEQLEDDTPEDDDEDLVDDDGEADVEERENEPDESG